jgi:hypothetical protein
VNVTPDSYPIISGFTLDTSLYCNLEFKPLAIAEYDALLRSGAYRSKAWVVPPDPNSDVVPAFGSFVYEIDCVPGSAIWAFSFNRTTNPGPFSFNVRDACTGVPLMSEEIRTDQFVNSDQQFLPKLLVVATPGLIAVEICSLQGTDATGVQLVLHGAEPVSPNQCET